MGDAPIVLPIQLTPAQVRPVAYRVISKKHGLNLKSAALVVLSDFLGRYFGADWRGPQAERTLDEISKRWKDEDRGIFVDGPPLEQVIKDWLNADAAGTYSTQGVEKSFDWRQYFKVVNATDQRLFVYDASKKNFTVGSDFVPRPFAEAPSLTNVFSSRYHILLDKLYRNVMFQPSSIGSHTFNAGAPGLSSTYTISHIKNMLGREPGSEFFLFGLLEKQTDGPWTLYDPTSNIPLEFTHQTAFAPDHYYTSGSFVLCHGYFLGDVFQVATLGPPPPEPRETSQEAFGNIDFYGLNGTTRQSKRIERLDPDFRQIMVGEEQKMPENRIVFAGANIYLDKKPIVEALHRMLKELDKDPPVALILSGSFISVPFKPHLVSSDGRNAARIYRDGMNELGRILDDCSNLTSNSKIVLVSGPNDPWHSTSVNVLPYLPLPRIFTGRVNHHGTDVVFATNPCRLCYLSQEIVIMRDDMGSKLRQNSLDVEAVGHRSTLENTDKGVASGPSQSKKSTTTKSKTPRASDAAQIENLSLDDNDEERVAERAALESMIADNAHLGTDKLSRKNEQSLSDTEEARRVMATLLDQCHLSPFSMTQMPVLWEFDQTLSLAQWPTVLVIVDPTTPTIKQKYEDCHVLNPGAFWYDNRANWLEFWPSTGDFRFAEC